MDDYDGWYTGSYWGPETLNGVTSSGRGDGAGYTFGFGAGWGDGDGNEYGNGGSQKPKVFKTFRPRRN